MDSDSPDAALDRRPDGVNRPALWAALVALVGLGVYGLTLAPGLTWAHDSGDGGELAAAAHVLGVPHPPGYPTYVLLAHFFTRLPLGEVATRTNLFSAVCAAGAAALLTWSLLRLKSRRAVAVGAGLALAVAPIFWGQAIVTEVYALNGLFTALLLVLAILSEEGERSLLFSLGAGITWGLSLGNHLTAVFGAPLVLLILLRQRRRGWLGLAGVPLGLSVYLILPLRAAAGPAINWGDPQTWERFVWLVSGEPYWAYTLALPGEYLLTRSLSWIGLLVRQFGALGFVLAVLGAVVLWDTRRSLLRATGGVAFFGSLFAIGYNTTDSYLYLLPAIICMGLWLGIGADELVGLLARRVHWAARGAVVLAVLLPMIAVIGRFPAMDLSQDWTANMFGMGVLDSAPPQAVLLSQRDEHTFTLEYFQVTQGVRPDVVVVDVDLLGYDWYQAQIAPALAPANPATWFQGGEALVSMAQAAGRPVCRVATEGGGLSCAEPP